MSAFTKLIQSTGADEEEAAAVEVLARIYLAGSVATIMYERHGNSGDAADHAVEYTDEILARIAANQDL